MTIVADKLVETIQQLTQSEREYIITSILNPTPAASDASHIISDQKLLGGEPVIRGTRTPVRAIVELWRMGTTPEEIPEHLPHISLSRVFDALSYYTENRAEINHYIEINHIPEHLIDPAVQHREVMA